ncbi:T9SS type A sorting domain-containing protein [Kordia jejudonensis]|uniref:T9SS type A sorting domain-containing protein n=1 Tax=Kordia jejudonensis TaxID=1348245 RepID=UPI00069A30BF|nr:T9SS type A sorting domain-containing protein [Kordia jejudonensis]
MKKFLLCTFLLIAHTSLAYQLTDIVLCDDDNDGSVCVDLTSKLPEILAGLDPTEHVVTFHESFTNANNGTNAIANTSNFCSSSQIDTIYVRLENTVNSTITQLDFIIYAINTPANQPTPLMGCDDNVDGFGVFYLATKIDEITGGPYTNRIVTFHETQADADTGNSPVNLVYGNISPFAQILYVRAARVGNNPITGCYETTTLELFTSTAACNNPPPVDSYEVEAIPFNLYTINATNTGNLDDVFTDVINLPFDFDFFEYTYNQFTIGTNGLISFDLTNANGYCAWAINSTDFIPDASLYENSIFGVYHDLLNTESGALGYGVIGEAPFRKMVVFFDDINQFGGSCDDHSTSQIILYETFNIIDVQIAQKISCIDWNGGFGILGIQNITATEGYAPVGRNTGMWDAFDEGHRFRPTNDYENIFSVLCDSDLDGFVEFDLQSINPDLLDGVTGTVSYFASENDAINNTNALPQLYTNITNAQKIYASIINTTTNEVTIKTVTLAGISCAEDYDLDGVATLDEDVNQDGNLGNDDTDGDGIPDFIDEDDDGDYVLTNLELVNTATGLPENGFLDTDNDQIPNHRDNDDDGDGTLTVDEDYNGNNNPEDDDTNNNNIPDYLDNTVFLSVTEFTTNNIRMYPNPVKDKFTIETNASVRIQHIEIYSVEGRLVHAQKMTSQSDTITVDVSEFASGFYVLRIKSTENTVVTKQFIVE